MLGISGARHHDTNTAEAASRQSLLRFLAFVGDSLFAASIALDPAVRSRGFDWPAAETYVWTKRTIGSGKALSSVVAGFSS